MRKYGTWNYSWMMKKLMPSLWYFWGLKALCANCCLDNDFLITSFYLYSFWFELNWIELSIHIWKKYMLLHTIYKESSVVCTYLCTYWNWFFFVKIDSGQNILFIYSLKVSKTSQILCFSNNYEYMYHFNLKPTFLNTHCSKYEQTLSTDFQVFHIQMNNTIHNKLGVFGRSQPC